MGGVEEVGGFEVGQGVEQLADGLHVGRAGGGPDHAPAVGAAGQPVFGAVGVDLDDGRGAGVEVGDVVAPDAVRVLAEFGQLAGADEQDVIVPLASGVEGRLRLGFEAVADEGRLRAVGAGVDGRAGGQRQRQGRLVEAVRGEILDPVGDEAPRTGDGLQAGQLGEQAVQDVRVGRARNGSTIRQRPRSSSTRSRRPGPSASIDFTSYE